MAIAVLVVLALCLVLTVYAVVSAERWRRRPRELRGDWWARFEREFRTYAKGVSRAEPGEMRHRDH
jgi:hypothetical protein